MVSDRGIWHLHSKKPIPNCSLLHTNAYIHMYNWYFYGNVPMITVAHHNYWMLLTCLLHKDTDITTVCVCLHSLGLSKKNNFNMETHSMYICQICKYENICNIYIKFEPIKFSWSPTNRENYYGHRYVYLGYIHYGALSTLLNMRQCVLIT